MIHIGTSGWQYRDWRGRLYPRDLAQKRWLEWYSARFATVEVNNTFYRLPAADTFASWAATVPEDFVFAIKLSRYLSHIKRLKEPEEPIQRFLAHALPLAPRMGPVLLQLPPDMRIDTGRLDAVLAAWPAEVRLAVEFRHESWFTDEVLDALRARDVALVLTDRHSRVREPRPEATASWGYVRLHEGAARPWPRYGTAALDAWVGRVAERWADDADVFVYFNNDPGGAAVVDAIRFAARARRAGLRTTDVPALTPELRADPA